MTHWRVTWLIYMRDRTHSYLWHLLIHIWLVYMCDLTCLYVCSRYDSYTSLVYAMWLPHHMRDMQHSYVMQHTATHCNTLQHTATHCNTLQHNTTHCNTLQHTATHCNTLQHSILSCIIPTWFNTLQHTATHCNTLQRTATHCNTLQNTATQYPDMHHSYMIHHTAAHCNTLQHTATHCNTVPWHALFPPDFFSYVICVVASKYGRVMSHMFSVRDLTSAYVWHDPFPYDLCSCLQMCVSHVAHLWCMLCHIRVLQCVAVMCCCV